jgi:predicted ABC-type ATPase
MTHNFKKSINDSHPSVVVIAGPNGAGKSTSAPQLLADLMGVTEFVNADTIASGLSAFEPEKAAVAAGRIMLARLKELAGQGTNFAFETTLASRSFAPWLEHLKVDCKFHLHLVYLWLPSSDLAIARVKSRVATGGHSIPNETIARRYERGLNNFFKLYKPLSNSWRFYNASEAKIQLVAAGGSAGAKVYDSKIWCDLEGRYLDDNK